jgi:hypothetical protein
MSRQQCVEFGGTCPANPRRVPDPDGAIRCYQHSQDPALEASRQAARVRGARTQIQTLPADRPKADLATMRGLRRELRELIHFVVTGQLAPEVGKVAIYGLGVGVKLAELEVHAVISELEKQVYGRRITA